MMKKLLVCSLLISIFWGANYVSAKAIAVIVNQTNPVDNLAIAQLARIYMGRQQQWPDGKRVVVVNRPTDSTIRKVFYQEVLDSEPTRKFHQPGSPVPFKPMIQRSTLATMRFVANMLSAIGYVYMNEVDKDDSRIKIIKVIK